MNRLSQIKNVDLNAEKKAHERWGNIAKPLGSLGLLEEMIEKIAAIQGSENVDISRRAVVVMCADNGVVKEGVTQSESNVTAICAGSIAKGESNINIIAKMFNAEVAAYDVGIACDVDSAALIRRKTCYGTGNIATEPAMTSAQAESAITVGLDAVKELSESGVKIIATGEMGIGNTTTAAAISAVLLGISPSEVTGRGAGLDSAGLKRKISVVERALDLHKPLSADRPLELISRIGGFDIAALTGVFLGGAVYCVPVIIDGVISAAAAALAVLINENARGYMLASHTSEEPAAKGLLDLIGVKAPINAGLRLGEGTGAAMLLPLLDAALGVYNSSHSFVSLNMERYVDLI